MSIQKFDKVTAKQVGDEVTAAMAQAIIILYVRDDSDGPSAKDIAQHLMCPVELVVAKLSGRNLPLGITATRGIPTRFVPAPYLLREALRACHKGIGDLEVKVEVLEDEVSRLQQEVTGLRKEKDQLQIELHDQS